MYCGRELGALSNHGNARPGHAWLPPSHPSRHTTPPRHRRLIYSYNSSYHSVVMATARLTSPFISETALCHRLIYCHNRARYYYNSHYRSVVNCNRVIYLILYQPEGVAIYSAMSPAYQQLPQSLSLCCFNPVVMETAGHILYQ